MKLLHHTADKVTLELSLHELHLANALIQEGRISHCAPSKHEGPKALNH